MKRIGVAMGVAGTWLVLAAGLQAQFINPKVPVIGPQGFIDWNNDRVPDRMQPFGIRDWNRDGVMDGLQIPNFNTWNPYGNRPALPAWQMPGTSVSTYQPTMAGASSGSSSSPQGIPAERVDLNGDGIPDVQQLEDANRDGVPDIYQRMLRRRR